MKFESLHLIVLLSVNTGVLSIKFGLKKSSRTQNIAGYASMQSLLAVKSAKNEYGGILSMIPLPVNWDSTLRSA